MIETTISGRELSALPLSLLRAELDRRQQDGEYEKPTCGSGRRTEAYNTPLHIFALVLILVLSTLACAFPIIARRFPKLPFPHRFLFLSRHFGTGVLIATAFVHLLPTAFVSLTDPCLPSFWNEGYPAMAGFIAMLSVFVVVSIEMFFATRGAGHVHSSEFETDPELTSRQRAESLRRFRQAEFRDEEDDDAESINLHPLRRSLNGVASKSTHSLQVQDNEALDLSFTELEAPDTPDESAPLNDDNDHSPTSQRHSDEERPHHGIHRRHSHHSTSSQSNPNPQKQLLQCLLLEAGILFHSIFIGMALSVATGTAFVVFLIAISFHQTFEGLALGSRIAALVPALFPPTSPKPWLMALAYGTTTPIGQAIGLGLHNLYDPASATGLLTVGITNSVSSGLLLFAGLVELLAEDFLSDRSYETLTGRRRIEACMAVAAGGLLMALVGAWA